MKVITHNQFIKYTPYIIFALSLIFLGAYGKITGSEMAIVMFKDLSILNMSDGFWRIAVGLGELFAGVGVFFKSTRKIAATIGVSIMAGAIFYHLTDFGGSYMQSLITMVLGVWILLSSNYYDGCTRCNDGVCTTCS